VMSCLESIANLMTWGIWHEESPEVTASLICRVQGIVLQFSQISEFGWITVIALNLFLVVSLLKNTKKIEWVYHLCVWGFASICTMVPTIYEEYGNTGIWCWLKRTNGNRAMYRWFFFYVPLFVMWLTVLVFYILVIRAVRQKLGEALRFSRSSYETTARTNTNPPSSETPYISAKSLQRAARLNILLRAYPAIFVILYAFPLANRIYNEAQDKDNYFLLVMQALTAPLLGFANSVAYGFMEQKPMWTTSCPSCKFCCWRAIKEPLIRREEGISDESIEFVANKRKDLR